MEIQCSKHVRYFKVMEIISLWLIFWDVIINNLLFMGLILSLSLSPRCKVSFVCVCVC